MNVLHLNSQLSYGGGLERIIVDLINNNKISSYLCIINNKWSKKHINNIDNKALLLCDRKEGSKNIFGMIRILYKIYQFKKKNNIDIIHCHDIFSLKIAYILKKISNVKIVFTVHDTNVYQKKLNNYKVDRYIAISKSVYTTIFNAGISKKEIDLIYNGVDLEKFKNLKTENSLNDVHTSISCVARIMPEKKGQDVLIRALGILKSNYKVDNFKCIFAGAIKNESTLIELEKLVEHYDLSEHVEFKGNVEKIEEVYAKTDIFVLPSRYEGFGLVIVEALTAGCKVIVSKLEGPLEIIGKEEYGLYFESENYNELAYKIYKLIQDKDYSAKYERYSKTMQYLEKEYSLTNMINNYNSVYREVLK